MQDFLITLNPDYTYSEINDYILFVNRRFVFYDLFLIPSCLPKMFIIEIEKSSEKNNKLKITKFIFVNLKKSLIIIL